MLLKEEAERNRQSIAKIIATNKSNDRFVRSISLMLDAANKINLVAQYLEQPTVKLEMLVENYEL